MFAMDDGESNVYIDAWLEFRSISQRLRKRFLRRPNLAQATSQLNRLSNRLEDEQCYQYAGLCQLAIARCEQQSGNEPGECLGLHRANRLFLTAADEERLHLAMPQAHMDEHLTCAAHCGLHAARLHIEHNRPHLAGITYAMLGDAAAHRGVLPSAVLHCYERAERTIGPLFPMARMCLLHEQLRAALADADHARALSICDQLERCVLDSCGVKSPSATSGAFRHYLKNCELYAVLLLSVLKLVESQMSEKHRELMQKYSGGVLTDGSNMDNNVKITAAAALNSSAVLDEDLFLTLQSFVMALQSRQSDVASKLMSEIWKRLEEPEQQQLMLELVEECKRQQ